MKRLKLSEKFQSEERMTGDNITDKEGDYLHNEAKRFNVPNPTVEKLVSKGPKLKRFNDKNTDSGPINSPFERLNELIEK